MQRGLGGFPHERLHQDREYVHLSNTNPPINLTADITLAIGIFADIQAD
ncbi:MAG: hypothetical protein F6K26_16295 [Moorea sp. SIO2I5]|nr:hypothetical protein [Moorena sp. SIO2I5]